MKFHKKIAKKILQKLGYSLIPYQKHPRLSLESSLSIINKYWQPNAVFDIGAAYGDFTQRMQNLYPHATYFLCDPLPEYKNKLKTLEQKDLITYIPKAVGSKNGKISFYKHDDLVGSSTKQEIEGAHVDGQKIEVSMTTLDTIFIEQNSPKNCLLKADVQGAELEVLYGATKTLKNTEVIILEVSFFRSMKQGADLHDIVSYMKKIGFVAYDIISLLYRPYDNALSQADVIFIKENSSIRNFLGYATKEQRYKQKK